MIIRSSVNNYWVHPNALTLSLNALGNPQYLQASLLAGSIVTAYVKDVIDYDQAANYRKWTLIAHNTQFPDTDSRHVYIRLNRDTNNPQALVAYSSQRLDLLGQVILDDETAGGSASSDYWYLHLGTISAAVDSSGVSKLRTWEHNIATGRLATDQYVHEEATGEWTQMFSLNSVTGLIDVLKTISSSTINTLKAGVNFILGGKTVTDIRRSSEVLPTTTQEDAAVNDSQLATAKYVNSEITIRALRKDVPDTAAEVITFAKGLKALGQSEFDTVKANKVEAEEIQADEATITKITVEDLTAILAKVHNLEVSDVARIVQGIILDKIGSDSFADNFDGHGFRVWKDNDGLWHGTLDFLTVRRVFTIFELLVQEVTYRSGMDVRGPAGGEITSVTTSDDLDYWICEVETSTTFKVDDQPRCQTWDGGTSNKFWWRKIIAVTSDGVIHISKSDCASGSIDPSIGDKIAVFGNRTDPTRRSVQVACAVGEGAPYQADYEGVNSYSLEGKCTTRIGNFGGLMDEYFGELKNGGIYTSNGYFRGELRLMSGQRVEEAIKEAVEHISVGGRNLLVLKNSTTSKYIGVDGSLLDSEYADVSEPLTVTSGQQYVFQQFLRPAGGDYVRMANEDVLLKGSVSSGSNALQVAVWDANGTLLDRIVIYSSAYVYDVPEGGVKMRVSYPKTSVVKIESGNVPTDWSISPEDLEADLDDIREATEAAQQAADNAAEAVDELDEVMNGAFRDGVIDDAERKAIAEQKKSVNEAWTDLDSSYTVVYQNTYLSGSAKTTLLNAKISLNGSRSVLNESIDNIIKATSLTSTLRNAYIAAYADFTTRVGEFKTALENANKSIQTELDRLAEAYADNAAESAEQGVRNYFSKSILESGSIAAWSGQNITSNTRMRSNDYVRYVGRYMALTCFEGYRINVMFYSYPSINDFLASASDIISLDWMLPNTDYIVKVPSGTEYIKYVCAREDNAVITAADYLAIKCMLTTGKQIAAWIPSAEDLQSEIDAMNDDGVFDLVEKQTIRTNWERIHGIDNTTGLYYTEGSYYKTCQLALTVSPIVSVTALTTAYSALKSYLNNVQLYTNSHYAPFLRQELSDLFRTYYNAEVAILDAVAKAAANTAENNAKSYTNSEVKAVADQVLLRVTKTTYEAGMSAVEQSIGEVSVKADSVEAKVTDYAKSMLGRNMLLKGDVGITTANYSMKSWNFGNYKPAAGAQYTITIWGELGEGRDSFRIYNSGGTVALCTLAFVSAGVYQGTFTHKIESTSNTSIWLFQFNSPGTSSSVVNQIKLELGVTGTDFTTAPEDDKNYIEEKLNETGINIESGQIDLMADLVRGCYFDAATQTKVPFNWMTPQGWKFGGSVNTPTTHIHEDGLIESDRVRLKGSIAIEFTKLPIDENWERAYRMDISNCYNLALEYVSELTNGQNYSAYYRRIVCMPQAQMCRWTFGGEDMLDYGLPKDGYNITIIAEIGQNEIPSEEFADHVVIASDPRLFGDCIIRTAPINMAIYYPNSTGTDFSTSATTITRYARDMQMFVWRGRLVPFVVIKSGQTLEVCGERTKVQCQDGTYRNIMMWYIKNQAELADLANFAAGDDASALYNPSVLVRTRTNPSGNTGGTYEIGWNYGATGSKITPCVYGLECLENGVPYKVKMGVQYNAQDERWVMGFEN